MKRIIFFTLTSLLSWNIHSEAQIILPESLKIPVEQAIERSKEIHNKEIELEIAQKDMQMIRRKYIPKIDASAGYAFTYNNVILDLPAIELPVSGTEIFTGKTNIDANANLFHGGVMAKSVIYSGHQIPNGVKAMKHKMKGDALLMETNKDSIVLDVITTFDQLRLIEATDELIRDSERRLTKEEERVNKAIENGLAIPFDRDKIRLAKLELDSKRNELDQMKSLLIHKLSYLTGWEEERLLQISYELEPFFLQEDLTIDDKPEIAALEAYQQAGHHVLEKERGTYLPQALAFAGASYSGMFGGKANFHFNNLPPQYSSPQLNMNQISMAPNMIAGVALRWNIYGAGERKQKVEKVKLNIRQLDNKLEDSRDKLNLLLLQKKTAYNTQWKQIDLATQKEIVAKNSLTMAQKQFEKGMMSITQRLEAENDFVKAGHNMAENLIKQRKTALELMLTTGNLSQKIQYN